MTPSFPASENQRRSAPIRFLQHIGVCCLALTMMLWLSDQGRLPCDVVVHVMAPDVDLVVDETYRHVSGEASEPLLFSLRPGRHELRMMRDGVILQRQTFEVVPNYPLVLTARDPLSSTTDPEDFEPPDPTLRRKSALIQPDPISNEN